MTERAWRPGKLRPGRFGVPPPGLDEPGGESLAAVSGGNAATETLGVSRAQNRHGGAPRGERTDRKVRAAP